MKILELCLSPDLGGLELYMYRCCDALLRQGNDVVAVINPQGRLVQYTQPLALERSTHYPQLACVAAAQRMAPGATDR